MSRINPVISELSASRYARLKPVPITAVNLKDDIFAPRRRRNRIVTLASQHMRLTETGQISRFERAAGKRKIPLRGRVYGDSDLYKWLEAVGWTLAGRQDPGLEALAEEVIPKVEASQGADGYVNTYFAFERAAERWQNLGDEHELYCAGHLIQAAIAHSRSTGDDRLLAVAIRFADLICELFGSEEENKRPGVPGHPEIEMALIELSRTTGNPRYIRQAEYFLNARGNGLIGGMVYHLDHRPFRQLERMQGHAVRALYLNTGATDLYLETGESALLATLERLWSSLTERQLYITGGVGARVQGEAFGDDYELPNQRAYAESCAAIANIFWNWRMLQIEGEARYADLIERALYNGAMVGLSQDGVHYFYQNPLKDDGHGTIPRRTHADAHLVAAALDSAGHAHRRRGPL